MLLIKLGTFIKQECAHVVVLLNCIEMKPSNLKLQNFHNLVTKIINLISINHSKTHFAIRLELQLINTRLSI